MRLPQKKRVELASQLKMLVLKIFGKKKFDPKTFWSMMNIALNGLKIRPGGGAHWALI